MNNRILICLCCGKDVPDDEEHNSSSGIVPYPHDDGCGMCIECGGDKNATDIKKYLGWAVCTFYEARFDVARNNLSTENQKKWDGFSYEKKCSFIGRLVKKGIIT